MNGLLDTHLLMWATSSSKRLSRSANNYLGDATNTFWFSSASIWEVAIKFSAPKSELNVNPVSLRRALVSAGYMELPINSDHTLATMNLPKIHKDPFDRILVAQALHEGLTLLTVDRTLTKYPGSIVRV